MDLTVLEVAAVAVAGVSAEAEAGVSVEAEVVALVVAAPVAAPAGVRSEVDLLDCLWPCVLLRALIVMQVAEVQLEDDVGVTVIGLDYLSHCAPLPAPILTPAPVQ